MGRLENFKMLIDGEWVLSSDNKTFESSNPTTGESWCIIPEASTTDVNKAVEAAHKAFTDGPWSKMTPTERGEHLRKLADILASKSEELGKIETIDTGKMLKETKWQAKYISQFFNFFAGCADKVSGQTLPIDKPDLFVFTNREPLGVVAAIVPWNSQLFLVAVKIGPALAAGNTIVLKASEHASAAMLAFGKCIEEAGIPPGVVNIITGHGDPCGKELTSHPKVARISFTGGPTSARHVIRNSAENFAEVSLELGGKSPFIVFDDADIKKAADMAIAAKFRNNGQVCISPNRFYIHERKKDEFVNLFIEKTKKLKIGDGMDPSTQLGPLTTKKRLNEIEELVEKTKEEGAKVLLGGKRPSGFNKGFYYEPTIFDDVKDDFTIMKQEPFGPLVPMLSFKSFDDVIKRANNHELGLCSYVCTNSMETAHLASEQLETGSVAVNTPMVAIAEAPFGGIKQSGYGREGGSMAIKDYLNIKYTHLGIKG